MCEWVKPLHAYVLACSGHFWFLRWKYRRFHCACRFGLYISHSLGVSKIIAFVVSAVCLFWCYYYGLRWIFGKRFYPPVSWTSSVKRTTSNRQDSHMNRNQEIFGSGCWVWVRINQTFYLIVLFNIISVEVSATICIFSRGEIFRDIKRNAIIYTTWKSITAQNK